jgi:hypothetical protein
MKELIITKELTGIDKSKAEQIEAVFSPMVDMLKSFETAYENVLSMELSEETCKVAKRLRLDISRIRIDADKARKEQKDEYLRAGNAIQGVYNILKFAVTDKEEKLKEIETYYERIEAEMIAKLQKERQLELIKYDADGEFIELGKMTDEVWKNYLSGVKMNYEAVKEAERKAEEDRIAKEKAEKAEQERIRKENEQLRKEREEAEKKRIALEKVNAEKIRKEREKSEEEQRRKDEIIRKEREEAERLRKEIEENKRKEAELQAIKEAELKRKREAGDIDKLKELLLSFDELRGGKIKSEIGQKAVKVAYSIIENAIKEIEEKK